MIPKKVQEQADRAEQLMQQQFGNTAPTEETPPQEPAPLETAVEQQQVQAQPEAPPQPDPWEHKYKVLANKYSAEVPRYAEELRELKRELQNAREEMERIKAAPPQPEITPKLTPAQVVEQFGEDFANAVGAIASQISEQKVGRVREEFLPQVKAIETTAVKSARATFMSELADLVPNWSEIDREDGFTAFLDEVDPLSGRSRREFFNEADARNDARRIAAFFESYRGKSSAGIKQDLSDQIAPPRAKTSTPLPTKKVWTQGEIRSFYTDARRGKYTPEQYRQIESDIDAAVATGRVAA